MNEKTWWIIVGGVRRLGLALAQSLSENHKLVLTSSQALGGDEAISKLSIYTNVIRLCWDANDPQLLSKMMTDLEALRGDGIYLSGAIIVAGTFPSTPLGSWDVNALQQIWQINLTFPFLAAQSLAPHLTDGSCIQFILDTCVHRPWLNRLPYSSAKSGLTSLVYGLAQSLAPNIRVVGHAIGAILPDENSDVDFLQNQTLLKRLGCPEDLSRAINYAASSPYLTGEILTLDGGRRWI
ncbi:MAG: SDR family oxidoreductase [Holophagales bacterium]|jgi:NAD(P)-dependent dehydrogenase (short-subunit alcohol dehydrogenase family)|nr:SDR family oxidoreductase [Holophagales bacterium]